MGWQEIISQKDFSLERVSSLIILLLAAMAGMILIVCPFINSYTNDNWDNVVNLISLLIVESFITLYWVYFRTVFPKGSIEKQNIIIAITTENNKQKIRISNDFTNNLKLRLKEYGLNNSYDIIVVHSHLSKEIKKRIEQAFICKKGSYVGEEERLRFNSMLKRMNAKFIVYGDLISRNAPNDRYYLNIEALICHNSTDSITGRKIKEEFQTVWKKEIDFLESEELTGFRSTSNQVFFASSYMIGLATFVDNKFDKGCDVFRNLMDYIQKNNEYEQFKTKIVSLLSTSYLLESLKLFYQGNIEDSIMYRKKYHELIPDEYDKCLNEAIFQVNRKKNPELALEFVERAEKLAKDNGIWKYNKLYLLIILNKHKDALNILDNILKTSFKDEIGTISQVISYNNTCLKEDENHLQTYFIKGVFIYKKLHQPVAAYEEIEKFIDLTNSKDEWRLLNERAKKYISEIDKIIEL